MGLSGQEIAEIRSLAGRSRSLLADLRAQAAEAAERRRVDLDQFGGDATQLIEQVSSQIANELSEDLAGRHSEVQSERDQAYANKLQELEQQRTEQQAQREAFNNERVQWEQVRDQIEADLASKEQGLAEALQRVAEQQSAEAADQSADREKLIADFANREKQLNEQRDQLATERDQAKSSYDQAIQEREQITSERDRLASECDQFESALAEANERLSSAQSIEAENSELREKTARILEDLGTHREQVVKLEEQLASRPDVNEADAAELAQLRHERDELTAQLESALAAPASENPSQELADLTRRFELAVEDVRDLKTENAELRDQLTAAQSAGPVSVVDPGGDDWESQKRRMLASLEGEGEPDPQDDPQRCEERVTIAGTIQITDGVVAEKDRELEKLRSELAALSSSDHQAEVVANNEATAALLDEDAIIQAERQRLIELEKEWEEKLRAAELELSLERAKIARAQAKLSEQQLELETLRNQPNNSSGGGSISDNKHKWLNKLGLGKDEDDSSKS